MKRVDTIIKLISIALLKLYRASNSLKTSKQYDYHRILTVSNVSKKLINILVYF